MQGGFADVIPSGHIVVGASSAPAADDLPLIALYPDKLAINQNVKETNSSQPRPQEFREEIAVNTTTPAGPYALAKTPLEKSTICKAIFDKGTVKERQALLVENKDFEIDYQQAKIVFTYDLAKASHILLKYSFVGVFTMREFQQDFLVDIFDDDIAEVEKWASLATGMILTSHDELIEQYNFTTKTEYTANQFLTYHTLDRIQMLEGVPSRADNCVKLQLKFKVVGQMKLTKAITSDFGLIEKIHSPGRISEQPVDVEIELG
ncbi:hypothetical protein HUU39_11615 [candidate division KSB1 bacterium]|nr:hypothetical protein [candidate division KSB1 bacterium]